MTEWFNSKQVSQLTGCNIIKAREIIRQINDEYREKGFIIPNSYKVPKNKLYERLGVQEEK